MFYFDHNVWQECDYDYTRGYVYGDYQQIVHKFYYQEEEDCSDL